MPRNKIIKSKFAFHCQKCLGQTENGFGCINEDCSCHSPEAKPLSDFLEKGGKELEEVYKKAGEGTNKAQREVTQPSIIESFRERFYYDDTEMGYFVNKKTNSAMSEEDIEQFLLEAEAQIRKEIGEKMKKEITIYNEAQLKVISQNAQIHLRKEIASRIEELETFYSPELSGKTISKLDALEIIKNS